MAERISIDLIRNNKFNPKKSMTSEETEFLKNSLSEWGHAGSITVCDDYEHAGKFIAIEGNSRLSVMKKMGIKEADVVVVHGIDSESRLKKITLDFVAATKRRDHKALFELYDDLDLQDDEIYSDIFGKIDAEAAEGFRLPEQNAEVQKFRKTIICTFTNEESYEKFKAVQGKHAEKIGKNSKLVKLIENYSDLEGFVENRFLDLAFRLISEMEEE